MTVPSSEEWGARASGRPGRASAARAAQRALWAPLCEEGPSFSFNSASCYGGGQPCHSATMAVTLPKERSLGRYRADRDARQR